jgi:dihydroneopterin aldolase
MSDLIKITGISAKGFHGVFPSERKKGQKFIVDVELNISLVNLKDDLSKTVNYAEVAQMAHDNITGDPVLLIETLAENIARLVLKKYKNVKQVKVVVHKPKAPISLKFKDVSVEIIRKR